MKFWTMAALAPAALLLVACNPQQPAPAPGGTTTTTTTTTTGSGSGNGLTGPDRTAFINSAIASCSAKQQSDPSNQGIPMSTITAFCTCYSTMMADKISMSELPSLSTADPTRVQQMLRSRIDEATTACAAQVRGNGGNTGGNTGGNPPAAPSGDNSDKTQ